MQTQVLKNANHKDMRIYDFFKGVSLRYRFGSGYTLAETRHATSVPHRLRLLRAFRYYPSRGNKVKNVVFTY